MNERERALRTLMQVMVSAGFAEAVNAWVVSLDPSWRLSVMVLMTFVVSYAQNWLEDHGYVRPVLKGGYTSDNAM
jgi:hypothetical protein